MVIDNNGTELRNNNGDKDDTAANRAPPRRRGVSEGRSTRVPEMLGGKSKSKWRRGRSEVVFCTPHS